MSDMTNAVHRVLFLHIPKTAGTSLRGFLEGLYPESYCCKAWFPDLLLKFPPWELAESYFIAGHYPVSILDWLPHKEFRTITFMREPLARTISHFNHLKTETTAFMHPVAVDCDLDAFLQRDDGLFELANMQTRYLGALDLDSEYFIDRKNISKEDADTWINGSRIEKTFQRALDFLEKCDVVGIVEQMQDSMLLLANNLGLSSQALLGHANRGKLRPPSISGKTLDLLREINKFDLRLYDEAKQILAKRIATLTPEQVDDSYRKYFASLPTMRSWNYTPENAAFSYGWHGREHIDEGLWARWSANKKACIDIPTLLPTLNYNISFHIGFYSLQQIEGFRFTVNGTRIPLQSTRCDEMSETQRIYHCSILGSLINNCKDYIRLGWEVDTLINPNQLFGEVDNRDLGIYLWWCEIMPIHRSDSNPSCGFCGRTIDKASLSFRSISMLSQGVLLTCENCHVITTIQNSPNGLGPQGQARFHELIFGTDPTVFSTYIDGAKLLRRVITSDYPDYFGSKTSELIFEVGAGRGSLLKALRDEGYSAIGCEYSAKLVEAGRAAYELPDSVLFQLNAWDLSSYLHKRSIQPTVLVFWHVIEHIENSLALLESLINVCADKVTLIFQTPLPVPEYVYPEHLFFPSTETYHFIAKRLKLAVKLLYVIPYTRFVTCVLSNKDVPQGKIFPEQAGRPGFSVIGQLITQLDSGLQELDKVTKDQAATIFRLQPQISTKQLNIEEPLTLVHELSQITDIILRRQFTESERNALLKQQMQQLIEEKQSLSNELLRAEAQLSLLKDVFLNNISE